MFVSQNMLEFEVKEEDGSNPPVDGSVGLDIGVTEHTLDVAGINFNNKLADADKVEVGGMEGMEKTVELELGLGIARLMLIPRDGAKAQRVAMTVGAVLSKDPAHSMDG